MPSPPRSVALVRPRPKPLASSSPTASQAATSALGIDREEQHHRLSIAGLSIRAQKLKRSDFTRSPSAAPFFDYINSAAYSADVAAGRGICLSGDNRVRSDLFALLAKPFAIAGHRVHFCTLPQLQYFLNDEERRTAMLRAKYLFVDGFEKELNSEDRPYTLREHLEIEDFLKARTDAGMVNHYSACRTWERLKWWSPDFRGAQADFVQDVALRGQ